MQNPLVQNKISALMVEPFTEEVIKAISSIPHGKVSTYGRIAKLAGRPRAARQVVRVLHSCSRKHHLPWHRVVGSARKGFGKITIPSTEGSLKQESLLVSEGVRVSGDQMIDLSKYGWP